MIFIKNIILLPCFMLLTASASAQNPVSKTTTTFKKFIPPKLTVSLGNHADTLNIISVAEAIKIIPLPLIITDAKKTPYTISTYKCMYKSIVTTEDEETGKRSPTTSTVAQLFRATPLSAIWQKSISEQISPDEEILFFDIVVKDATGRFLFAPNFKIIINSASN